MAIEIKTALLLAMYIYKKKMKYKRIAVRKQLKERRKKGYFHALRLNDTESFIKFHRMDHHTFDEILKILGPFEQSMPVRQQEHISLAKRLSLTPRYLASGDSMKSIGYYGFRIGASTTSKIIKETTELIWKKFQFVFPKQSTSMCENIACHFYDRWGFPNCLGAIDGKHVVIQALPKHNSLTFNYKHSHSIVLMAVADADYKFIFVDIGALGHNSDGVIFKNCKFGKAILENSEDMKFPDSKVLPGSNISAPYVFLADEALGALGHNSDGGIFKNCKFGKAILENSEDMKFPDSKVLPGSNISAPYVFLANEAFPLRKNILRPYPGRSSGNMPAQEQNFNKHLSRARRVVENSFGILANRFRIYRKPIVASKETVINIVKATVCLHNFLRERKSSIYVQHDLVDREGNDGVFIPGSWRKESHEGLQSIGRVGSNRASSEAAAVRNMYTNYFNT